MLANKVNSVLRTNNQAAQNHIATIDFVSNGRLVKLKCDPVLNGSMRRPLAAVNKYRLYSLKRWWLARRNRIAVNYYRRFSKDDTKQIIITDEKDIEVWR